VIGKWKEWLQDHPVLSFFVLAYTLTWISWTPISYLYDRGLIELSPGFVLLYIAGGFGPLLAGGIMAAITGPGMKKWFLQAVKWKVSARWWAAAFLIPVVLYTLMTGIHLALGGTFNWGEASLLSLPGGFLSVFLWGGGNEELGWRGYALPRLQKRFTPLISSVIIGAVWTLWHAPPGIIELGWREWALDLPFYTATVIGISFIATWLYNKTDGSVLIPMVFHASVNASQSLYPVEEMFSMPGEIARMCAWALLVLALVLIPSSNFLKGPSPENSRSGADLEESAGYSAAGIDRGNNQS
jgi:membrane protease YdiL (CAAX protease family)